MSLCVTVLLLLVLVVGGAMCTESSHFVQEEMCDVEESVSRGCSKVMDVARDAMECTRMCWRDTECLGASLDVQGRCLHHLLCHTSVPCPTGPDAVKHRYMARYCVHGTWDSSTQSCVCRYETFGERCNQYHTLCESMIQSGYANGRHLVILNPLEDGEHLFKVFCSLTLKSNTCNIRMLFNSGQINFNRTWNEYVNGFFEDSSNLWIGLRAVKAFSKVGITNMFVFLRVTGGNVYALYRNLTFGNDNRYSFWADYSGSWTNGNPPSGFEAKDCLSSLQGVPFSTWDRDQDSSVGGENCASLAGSGWWYKDGNCDLPCNLLGWGLDNYNATPPRQRLTYLGSDVARDPSLVLSTDVYLRKV